MYYFDNSATTLQKPASVAEAVYQAIAGETLGNPSRSSHDPSLDALRLSEQARHQTADFFGTVPARVAFTANATAALNFAIKGILTPQDHIITTVTEHNAVLRPLYQLEQQGAALSFVGIDEEGTLQYEQFQKLLRPNTRAVVVNHASNVTGNVVDLDWIGRFCREHQLYLFVDASQSAGLLEISMRQQDIDVLCFTGHKSLYGPQGTGGICLSERIQSVQPVFSGGSGIHTFAKQHPADLPGVFEPGTMNVHGLAGLRAGLEYIRSVGITSLYQKAHELERQFYEGVRDIPGIRFYGAYSPSGEKRMPIVSLTLEGWSSGDLADALWLDYEIAVRPGAHCAPLLHEAFGTAQTGMVRFSFSSFNISEEVTHAIQALEELAAE